MDNSTIKEIRICPRCGKYTTTYSTICPHCKKLILGTEDEYIKHKHFILSKKIIMIFMILSIIFSVLSFSLSDSLIVKETEIQKINYNSYSQKLEYGTEAYADIIFAVKIATLSMGIEQPMGTVKNTSLKSSYYYGLTNIEQAQEIANETDYSIILEIPMGDNSYFVEQLNSCIENGVPYRVYGEIVQPLNDISIAPNVQDYDIPQDRNAQETIQDFNDWYEEQSSGNAEVLKIINSYKILKVDDDLPVEKEVVLSTRLTVGGYAFMISLILIFLLFVALTIVKNKTNDFIINIQIHSRNAEGL